MASGGTSEPSIGEQADDIQRQQWMEKYPNAYALVGEVEDCAWLQQWADDAQEAVDLHLEHAQEGI